MVWSWVFGFGLFSGRWTLYRSNRSYRSYTADHYDYSLNEFFAAILSYIKIGITMLSLTMLASCHGKA
jgi:hypothetical protein